MRKLICFIVAFVLLVTAIPAPKQAKAFVVSNFKHQNTYVKIRYAPTEQSRAITFFGYARSAWNNSTSLVELHYSSEVSSIVFFQSLSVPNVTWDGLTGTQWDSSGYVLSQAVTINRASDAWSDDGALLSVIVHEFGHVLGLADVYYVPVIMNGMTYDLLSRYEYFGLTSPQVDDISGIISLYQ